MCVCGCLSNILIAENSGGSCQAVFVNTTSSSSHCARLENMALFFCCKSRRLQISINVKETGACTSVCTFSTWHGGIHFCSEGELWVPSASAPDTQQKDCCPLCLHGRAPVARAAAPVQMRPGGWGYTHSWGLVIPSSAQVRKQAGWATANSVRACGTSHAWLVLL